MPYMLQTKFFEPTTETKEISLETAKPVSRKVSGPSLYEVAYLKDLAEELNVFLHSKGFSTIEEIHVGVAGKGYRGHLKIVR